MKTLNLITKLIAITMAVAAASLLSGNGLLQPVAAQTGDGSVKFFSYASLGIVPGDRVRLNVANTRHSGGPSTLSFSYYLAHDTNSASVPLYESELIQVPPGEIRSAEVSHTDLKIEGEPLTSRVEMIVRVNIVASAGSDAEDFPCSLEVFPDEARDGNAIQIDSRYRLIIVAAQRSKQLNAPISFMPGHRLSYTFINPNEEGSQPVCVQAYTYDGAGRLITQTDPVKMEPGQTHNFNINHDDLRVAGPVQVRTDIQVVLMDGSVRHVSIPVWMELVNNSTGATIESSGGSYYAGTVSVSGDGF